MLDSFPSILNKIVYYFHRISRFWIFCMFFSWCSKQSTIFSPVTNVSPSFLSQISFSPNQQLGFPCCKLSSANFQGVCHNSGEKKGQRNHSNQSFARVKRKYLAQWDAINLRLHYQMAAFKITHTKNIPVTKYSPLCEIVKGLSGEAYCALCGFRGPESASCAWCGFEPGPVTWPGRGWGPP